MNVPDTLPFLRAISWYEVTPEKLPPEEMLSRYEAGWRYVGVLGDPSPEEIAFIRELIRRYGSTIEP